MDATAAVDALPDPYARALRAALAGEQAEAIADELDVPVESVRNVVRVAVAKLASLLDE